MAELTAEQMAKVKQIAAFEGRDIDEVHRAVEAVFDARDMLDPLCELVIAGTIPPDHYRMAIAVASMIALDGAR